MNFCNKKTTKKKETNKKDFYQNYFISFFHIPREINDKKLYTFRSRYREREREREGERGGETESDEREVGGINDRRDKGFQGNRETNDNSLISSPIFFLDRTYAQDKLFVSG